jgi:S-adenosylmethionine hydrolase
VKPRRGDTGNIEDRPVSQNLVSPKSHHQLITLLTDFGTSDYFVGAVKAVILSVNPSVTVVDITHDIPPQDIAAGAFNLLASYRSFPPGTIHVAVVDPGVGSARKPILVAAGGYFFIGPDNGVFSYIYERETVTGCYELNRAKYFHLPVSSTFHGRDIFAPVAAALSTGIEPDELGNRLTDLAQLVHLEPLVPAQTKNRKWRCRIIHIDRFGNVVTNITRNVLSADAESRARLRIGRRIIKSFRKFFADDGAAKNEPFAIWGSAGFLEIAAPNRSAARLLKAKRGQSVTLELEKRR